LESDLQYAAYTGGIAEMSRLIFLIAVIVVVYLLLKSFLRQSPKRDKVEASEDMVRCSQCGVHLPKSESILSGGEYYCCDAHRRERDERKK
jgi:uncharacterized protein